MGLCGGNAGNASSRCRRSSSERLRSITVRGHCVLDRRLLVAVGAVVVADKHVGVGIAQADEIIAVCVAGVDTGFVTGHAGIDDAGMYMLTLRSEWIRR
jgi:hypothetical protein